MSASRRSLIALAAATALLAACNQSGGGGAVEGDMALGPADAKVTVIEYASLACSHCAEFHETVWPQLKANYIDTGKIRFIFREFPTGSPQIASAQHLLARCMASTPEKYFEVVSIFFEQQQSVFQSASMGQVREKLLEIARTSGGLSEQQFGQCISDQTQIDRLNKVAEDGARQFKVAATPTIIINGETIPQTPAEPYTYERLSALIDAKLGAR